LTLAEGVTAAGSIVRSLGIAVVWQGRVEGDAQADLDVPAGDADLVDEQPQELLLLHGVQVVDDTADPFGEVVHAAA
jgi:hypothetical protein